MNYVIKFSKPYPFEGTTYTELDISKINELTGKTLMSVESRFETFCTANDYFFNLPEKSTLFASILCSEICSLPYEFFDELPAKDLRQIATRIYRFFYFEDSQTENETKTKDETETIEA